MWPFSTRRSRAVGGIPAPTDLPSPTEFERNDASVKVWLPLPLTQRLDWLSAEQDISRQDVIRALLFQHLYGQVAYLGLLRWHGRQRSDHTLAAARQRASQSTVPAYFPQPKQETELEEISRSRPRMAAVAAEMFGPATENWRLDMPRRMREDLKEVAGLEHLPVSELIRKILVLLLLGAPLHARWQAAIGRTSAEILRLEAQD